LVTVIGLFQVLCSWVQWWLDNYGWYVDVPSNGVRQRLHASEKEQHTSSAVQLRESLQFETQSPSGCWGQAASENIGTLIINNFIETETILTVIIVW